METIGRLSAKDCRNLDLFEVTSPNYCPAVDNTIFELYVYKNSGTKLFGYRGESSSKESFGRTESKYNVYITQHKDKWNYYRQEIVLTSEAQECLLKANLYNHIVPALLKVRDYQGPEPEKRIREALQIITEQLTKARES